MQIRFLQTVPSRVPGFPFQAGQIITIAEPTTEILAYLDGIRAEVVRETTPERAVAMAPSRGKRRRTHAGVSAH